MSYEIEKSDRPHMEALPVPELTAAHIRAIMLRTEKDESGCWVWNGASYAATGYARYEIKGRTYKVHRLMCDYFNGRIPLDMVVDHLCRNTSCVNPAHLEAVTHEENVRRGDNPTVRALRQTHCKRGHEFTVENTLLQRDRKGVLRQRACRTCARMRKDERKRGLR